MSGLVGFGAPRCSECCYEGGQPHGRRCSNLACTCRNLSCVSTRIRMRKELKKRQASQGL